jgi:hypothetical protein
MITSDEPKATFWPLPLHAIALVSGPALVAAGMALDGTGGTDVSAYIRAVQQNPGGYLAGGLVLQAGMISLVPAGAALLRLAAGHERVRLLRVGALLLALWAVGAIPAGISFTAGWVTASPALADAPRSAVEAVFTQSNSSPWLLGPALAALVGMVGGILFVGIGLLRCRLVPWWSGALVLAALPLTLACGAGGFTVLDGFALALLPVGLAAALPALLRRPRSGFVAGAAAGAMAGAAAGAAAGPAAEPAEPASGQDDPMLIE